MPPLDNSKYPELSQHDLSRQDLSRRGFLSKIGKFGLIGVSLSTFGTRSFLWGSEAGIPWAPEKSLSFYHTHTGEFLKKCVFWAKGDFVPEGQTEINKFFRDHRTGDLKDIDPQLLLLLHDLQENLDTTEPLQLISGYRSPKTNAMLRKKSSKVAKKSRHLSGQAADINLPGRLPDIHKYVKKLGVGGVGKYPGFVHVDTGPIRHW